jgi:hypothetical protein
VLRPRPQAAVDREQPAAAADDVSGAAGDPLDEKRAGRQIAAPVGEPAHGLGKVRKRQRTAAGRVWQ